MIIRVECDQHLETKIIGVVIDKSIDSVIADICSGLASKHDTDTINMIKTLFKMMPEYENEIESTIFIIKGLYRILTGENLKISPIRIVSSYGKLRSKKRVILCISAFVDGRKISYMYYVSDITKEYRGVIGQVLSSLDSTFGHVYTLEEFMNRVKKLLEYLKKSGLMG